MIRCREIGSADLDAIADLLTRGFPHRSRDYWIDGYGALPCRGTKVSRFGYMATMKDAVSVLLLINTARDDGGGPRSAAISQRT